MDKKKIGQSYEDKAAAYLEEKGVTVLERNFRCRQGEIDIIGLHGSCLVFVEVKYRKSAALGMPEEAVGIVKQLKICMVSDYYRVTHPSDGERQIRYDVVAICGEVITWYQNAFPYHRKGRHYFSW